MPTLVVLGQIPITKRRVAKMQVILQSKRFWLSVASVFAIAIKDYLPLTDEQVKQIVLAIGAWIIGDSLRSTVPPKITGSTYR